ncbi:RNA polymerase sigma factor [Allosphingosinicella sp.]|uniref:RNA polymerase sigma factor n=1 Tax=Allosphingosinicella sp. TaxID=2823234 RepID=UPI003783D08F
MAAHPKIDYDSLDDPALARMVATRDRGAVRLVTQRNNQRLVRAAWSILKDRAEAEDAVQSAYLSAFAAIGSFEGRASLSTWLTRIVINEALGRARAAKRRRAHFDATSVTVLEDYREKLMQGSTSGTSPEKSRAQAELRSVLQSAVARLPEPFRVVFVLREIEELSVEDVAEALDLPPATVKTRHFRARKRLRDDLAPDIRDALNGSFPFAGADCEAMTEYVVAAFCGRD